MEERFLISGDSSMIVQMGSEISLEVNSRVRSLFKELTENPVEGIVEMVPTYASLTIHYRPEKIRFAELEDIVRRRMEVMKPEDQSSRIIKEIPVCYGGEMGPDLEWCAEHEQISPEELIRRHSENDYYVYMLGFAPGHPYMARFNEPFTFRRRETPRVKIPAGCVVVQLNLSDLIPFPQPCGWNIIGMTPLTICDYSKPDPFLVHAGDWVRHVPVTPEEFRKIEEDVRRGTYQVKTYEKAVE